MSFYTLALNLNAIQKLTRQIEPKIILLKSGSFPTQPVNDRSIGWGDPVSRHQALDIISERDYLTHKACDYRTEGSQ